MTDLGVLFQETSSCFVSPVDIFYYGVAVMR